MNETELIDELTDICTRQAEIIRKQAYEIEQLAEMIRETEGLQGDGKEPSGSQSIG